MNDPVLSVLGRKDWGTRESITWGVQPADRKAQFCDVRGIETVFKPAGFRFDLPRRRFVFPCRALCGLDLKRIRFTCFADCRIRRVYSGRLPAFNEIKGVYTLTVLKRRRSARVKDAILKRLLSLAEWCAN